MRPEDFSGLLQLSPMQPFRIHFTNGRSYDIRHRDFAEVRRSVVWLHSFEPNSDRPPTPPTIVTLIHIVHVEFISPTDAGTSST